MNQALPDAQLRKAHVYLRALRRAVIAYWYATVEDGDAALIEAATASFYVNLLDEAVFAHGLGTEYEQLRTQGSGRVVLGLELVRNCETHAGVVAEGLLVNTQIVAVPASGGSALMRSIYRWAELADLPTAYVNVTDGASDDQRRARGAALDGYVKAVAGRPVLDTLLDAIAFFQSVDNRLAPSRPSLVLPWAFAELPVEDPTALQPGNGAWVVARPLGLDLCDAVLPDLACRPTERRTVMDPATDATLKATKRTSSQQVPAAIRRELKHIIRDEDSVVGYGGLTGDAGSVHRQMWVDRRARVWRDVRAGYPYFVARDDVSILVRADAHLHIEARRTADGEDVLELLPQGRGSTPGEQDYEGYLELLEAHPDLYIAMRRAQ